MGWFSPIKGHYPSLGQIDKTLPVATSESTIADKLVRGTIVQMKAGGIDGVFGLPVASADVSMLYVALQRFEDDQANMAGTVYFDGNVPSYTDPRTGKTIPGVTKGQPAITGLALSMEGEYETDMVADDITENTAIGVPLYATTDGKITATSNNATAQIGILTGKLTSRWVNDAEAKTAGGKVVRQGKNVNVIRFRTK